MDRLKRKKAKLKAAYTRAKSKLVRTIEGELFTKVQIVDLMDNVAAAFEELICSYDELAGYYESNDDKKKLQVVSCEIDALELDFTETEQIVKGYLMPSTSTTPQLESGESIDIRSKNLQQEIDDQEEEITNVIKELEETYRKYAMKGKQAKTDSTKTLAQAKESRKTEQVVRIEKPKVGQEILPESQLPAKQSTEESNTELPIMGASAANASPIMLSSHEQKPSSVLAQSAPVLPHKVFTSTPYYSQNPVSKAPLVIPVFQPGSQSSTVLSQAQVEYPQKLSRDMNISQQLVKGDNEHLSPFYQQPANSSSSYRKQMDMTFDSTRLLTRVSIPKFKGEKKNYESWKAAFMTCIDSAAVTPEYKLLKLLDSMEGEPLKVIESLGHSAAAYDMAKERLDRKYGGKRRQMVLRLEELNRFKQVRDGNARELESFAELLDVLKVNLCESGQQCELGGGALYVTLQRKLSETLLSRYNRWVYEHQVPETVETLRVFVNQESEFLTTATETLKGLNKDSAVQKKDQTAKTFVGHTQSPLKGKSMSKCQLCKGIHGLWACERFKSMDVEERWKQAKGLHICFRCLSSSHQGKFCPRDRVCGIDGCTYKHNRLLHEKKATTTWGQQTMLPQPSPPWPTEVRANEEENHTLTTTTDSLHVDLAYMALRTVPVILKNGPHVIRVNALLDDGSTRTYLNQDIAAQLCLEGEPEQLTVNVLNGHKANLESSTVDFTIESVDGELQRPATAYTTKRVTGNMQVVNWNRHKDKWKHLQAIKFPQLGKQPIVDILIGVDQADLHCSLQDIAGEPGEPIARCTPLGWTCIGCPLTSVGENQTNFSFFQHNESAELNELVRRYWEVEESGPTALVKPEEKCASDMVSESITYLNGRYCVGIPWKNKKATMPDNYEMAVDRLGNTEKRLLRVPEVGRAYQSVLDNYLEKDYIRKVSPTEAKPDQVWYLPHFPVLKPDKTTTKTRIVFDASAKRKGISLNDRIYQGPKLQTSLVSVLVRFRQNQIALMCDIAEMYLQIELKPEDKPFHRFLWRDLNQGKPPDTYEFNRVVFGVNASPFLAQFVSRHNAIRHMSKYPLATETVLKSTYMDDSMVSVKDVATAIELQKQLAGLYHTANMHARKWLSNSPDVLQNIPTADHAVAVDLDKGKLPSVKTLGVLWSPQTDEFMFSFNCPDEGFEITKRSFLKKIASLFDPLGLLMPFTIRGRILLQRIWESGLGWDQPLSQTLRKEVEAWFVELPSLIDIRIPRCLRDANELDTHVTLHAFADASINAYGAVVYARHKYADGHVVSRLVASKARVAPLQAMSVPRLELMAAMVALKLTESLGQTLEIPRKDWQFWSDSMDVLHWIRGHSRHFKPFVANRVGEIQLATDPAQWRFIPTQSNPADLLTRGESVSDLVNDKKWWNGPHFLPLSPPEWPENNQDQK